MISILALTALLELVGFTPTEIPVMICIAEFESSYNSKAVNVNKNGSTDQGLFQINDGVWSKVCTGDMFDLASNLRCARHVYLKQGYTAWVAYKPKCEVKNETSTNRSE
jgi:hypothetical protein